MQPHLEQMKRDWDERQTRMGLTKRAVLFKRFPGWLNEAIHRRHATFVVRHVPPQARSLLDIGCGYGRLSAEVKRRYPRMEFHGVDLCTEFALAYERDVGPCFNGPVQEFSTTRRFDAILIVTCLMYLAKHEHGPTLERLWGMLNPGGSLVCIEPAFEILQLWRRLTRSDYASPTGGSVYHFHRSELRDVCHRLPEAVLRDSATVCLIPGLTMTAIHHAVAVTKPR